jgi:hypothetical protein
MTERHRIPIRVNAAGAVPHQVVGNLQRPHRYGALAAVLCFRVVSRQKTILRDGGCLVRINGARRLGQSRLEKRCRSNHAEKQGAEAKGAEARRRPSTKDKAA